MTFVSAGRGGDTQGRTAPENYVHTTWHGPIKLVPSTQRMLSLNVPTGDLAITRREIVNASRDMRVRHVNALPAHPTVAPMVAVVIREIYVVAMVYA